MTYKLPTTSTTSRRIKLTAIRSELRATSIETSKRRISGTAVVKTRSWPRQGTRSSMIAWRILTQLVYEGGIEPWPFHVPRPMPAKPPVAALIDVMMVVQGPWMVPSET